MEGLVKTISAAVAATKLQKSKRQPLMRSIFHSLTGLSSLLHSTATTDIAKHQSELTDAIIELLDASVSTAIVEASASVLSLLHQYGDSRSSRSIAETLSAKAKERSSDPNRTW